MEGRNAEVLAVRTSAVQATLLGPTKPLGQSANRLSWTMGHDGTIWPFFSHLKGLSVDVTVRMDVRLKVSELQHIHWAFGF